MRRQAHPHRLNNFHFRAEYGERGAGRQIAQQLPKPLVHSGAFTEAESRGMVTGSWEDSKEGEMEKEERWALHYSWLSSGSPAQHVDTDHHSVLLGFKKS